MNEKELIESALREAKDFSKAIRKYFYEVSEVRPLLEQDKELYELAHKVHIHTNDAIMLLNQ